MKVVLDANIIIADFWMRSPGFKVLFENAKQGNIELAVPQVVLDEVLNKFEQRLEKSRNDINSENTRFEKLADMNTGISMSDKLVAKAKAKYHRHFKKVISDNEITILPYPTTSHAYLAKKAMQGKKPFNSNEKGYRDNPIWENVKSLITASGQEVAATPELIFISNNHNDFAGDNHQLHAELERELDEEDLRSDSIEIYSSLAAFNDKIAKMFLAQANQFTERLQKNDFDDFDLKTVIDKFLFKDFLYSSLYNYYLFAGYANDSPMVSSFDDDYIFDSIVARKLNSREFLVDVKMQLETEIDYFIDKSEYLMNDGLKLHVIDAAWNDHVVAVSDTVTLELEISLIINSKFECTSIEIAKINGEYLDSPDY